MDVKYEAIICIVNSGFSESVMAAAKQCGARGGTVINARGTAKEETEKLFNISIHPEKEIVLILVDSTIKDDILHAIYHENGLSKEGQGIVFSLPVDDVVGISQPKPVLDDSNNNENKENSENK